MLDPLAVDDDVLVVGVWAGCCSEVVVEEVDLPCVVAAAANENIPASPIAPPIIQRLIRESNFRPRSREGGFLCEGMHRGSAHPARER